MKHGQTPVVPEKERKVMFISRIFNMMLFLAIGVFILVSQSCSGDKQSDTSGLKDSGINLSIDVGDSFVDTINWEIFDDTNTLVDSGSVDVSQPGSTVSLEYFGLLPGNYTIVLSAVTDDGILMCEGSAAFTITAGVITDVYIVLNCDTDPRFGGVRVNGELNVCADLTTVVVSPLQVEVGYNIDLMAAAEDAENDPITYNWTATSGSFNDPSAANTQYTCEAPGTHTLTLGVSDDNFTHCVDSFSADVTCVSSAVCGNEVVEPGEQCEPPDTAVCNSECQWIPGATVTQTVPLVCSNNVTPDIMEIPYELTVIPLEPVFEGAPTGFQFTGVVNFPPAFLNAALATIPGITEVTLNDLNATVIARSGATGSSVVLGSAVPTPATLPIPIVNDSAQCSAAGLPTPCVLQPMQMQLTTESGTFTPTATGTDILFGWNEDLLPPISFAVSDPAGPNGIRVVAIVLSIGMECYMGRMNDNGTPGNPADDFPEALPDGILIAIPVN